ncbi:two-component regulator propeller domain-containing protein [Spirosoma montaniterrae]|uniref:Transcriptional regulator n=1 Tax=Spirosoma montaniterrae TaxID=1178516 RepID=A0A1P9X2H5_9BACT|nr:T9SS type A sorting domain-containing protein [Spirosoma montaniterrae]AQG81785.1 transcriptional regulator [Spirosoma montaniterrae]
MKSEKWLFILAMWRKVFALNATLSLFIFHFSFFTTHAQLNAWQSHASYRSGRSVAVVGNKVYAATQNGFFYFDKTTREITTLRKEPGGLSDVGISRLLFLPDQQRLLIAYRSGTIDLLTITPENEPGAVQTVSTIATAPNLPASRSINHILRIGNNAYLSTDFGLVVFDVVRSEIRDTYFSRRPDGSPLPILQTAVTSDSLYALTEALQPTLFERRIQAVRFAPNVNIADPANWRTLAGPAQRSESIATDRGRLIASVNGQGIFERQPGRWVLTQPLTNGLVRVFSAPSGLIVTTERSLTLPGAGLQTAPLLSDPRELVIDGGQTWAADAQTGVLSIVGTLNVPIAPAGPSRDGFARLYAYSNTLVALPNGPQDATLIRADGPTADQLNLPDGQWQRITGSNIGSNAATYLQGGQRLYTASFGSGLASYDAQQGGQFALLPPAISPRITDLSTDFDGNLWITTNSNTPQANLHVRRPDGTFQSFPAIRQPSIEQVVPDDNGFLWLRLQAGSGLLVFDPQTNRSRFLTTLTGEGALPTNSVRSLVKDRTGAIWVGTDLGPTVFDNPADVFRGAVDAQPPLLNQRRLLANEQITALAVDGGNRKWIGTRSGLYVVSPDGSQLLETFTSGNSPLPNNLVQSIAIEPVSGRVFVQTGASNQPMALVSYGGAATEPAETLTGLTIFPNPVRPDFTGTVGINGLTENATVKILDAGGTLVYETRSQGGTASWDLRDYRGRSAQTGIYLIVVITADGTEGLAGKLAVVR